MPFVAPCGVAAGRCRHIGLGVRATISGKAVWANACRSCTLAASTRPKATPTPVERICRTLGNVIVFLLYYNITKPQRPVNLRTSEISKAGAVVIALSAHRRPPEPGPGRGRLDVVPADVAQRTAARPALPWRSGLAALALHASFVGAAFWLGLWSSEPSGGGGQHLEAISVSLVASQVLESSQQRPSASGGGASADVAANEGSPEQKQQSVDAQVQEAQQQPAPVERAVKDADAPAVDQTPHQPTAATAASGGATARALTASPQPASSAGASAGEINRYAMAVRAALARSKPRGTHQKGTVTIAFGIDENGEVRFARVTERSGYSSLDDATVAAVKRTSFPRPPSGMSAEQRSYVVPFRFK